MGPGMSEFAPDGGPWLLLSAKGMSRETGDDFECDFPGCRNRAVDYLFMGPQFCCPAHCVSDVFEVADRTPEPSGDSEEGLPLA